jgi:hypothetical protein
VTPIRMTTHDRAPLPVSVLPMRDECGQGLLFRVAQMNGLRLRTLYQLAGVGARADSEASISALAGIAGVSRNWLSRSLVQRYRVTGEICQYQDREWSSPLSLRPSRPQVCPECLRSDGYCAGVWMVSGYAVCHVHGRHLVDQCAKCSRSISWNRPALTVCQCRWEFGRASAELGSVDPAVLAWCRWAYRQLYGRALSRASFAAESSDECLLPRWLSGLGVEVAFLTLHAFGVRERKHQRIATRDATEACSPREMAEILGRGMGRSRALDHLNLAEIRALDGWVYEEGIERMARRAQSAADHSFAATCLHSIRLANEHRRPSRRHRQMHQPDLFEGQLYE